MLGWIAYAMGKRTDADIEPLEHAVKDVRDELVPIADNA